MAQRAATSKNQVAVLFILPIFLLMLLMPQQMISVFTHKGVYDGHLTADGFKTIKAAELSDYKLTVGSTPTTLANGNLRIQTDVLNESYMDKLGGDYVRIASIS